jgi:hypothetical protein
MPWLGGARPAAPLVSSTDGRTLSIVPGDSAPVTWWMLQALGADGHWGYALRRANDRLIDLASIGDIGGGKVAVTAVDRAGQLSGAVLLAVQ